MATTHANASSPFPVPANSTASMTEKDSSNSDSPTLTIAFGIMGVFLAAMGIVIAALQLRHMYRRKKLVWEDLEAANTVCYSIPTPRVTHVALFLIFGL